jgi:hypothetical protein
MSDDTSSNSEDQPPEGLETKVVPSEYVTAVPPRADRIGHHGGQPANHLTEPTQAKRAPQDSDEQAAPDGDQTEKKAGAATQKKASGDKTVTGQQRGARSTTPKTKR